MTFEAAAYSAKGIRELNEDSFIISSIINKEACSFSETCIQGTDGTVNFFAVADGMGGQGSGEKASNFVVSKLKEISNKYNKIDEIVLSTEIEKIHKEIILQDKKMGSTLTGILIQKGECGIVNLGDSRIYRLRNDMFLKMTNDDSLKRYDASAASNIITNGIGGGLSSISVNTRFSETMIISGDRFLLCSDGVYGYVSDMEIESILGMNISAVEAAAKIVQTAIKNGTDDNCTAVVVFFKE